MKKILFTILLSLSGILAFSQHSSIAYRKLADSLYVHHHYQIAADYYEKAIKKSPHQGNIMLQLAKCYHKMNLISESEKWFLKAKRNHGAFSIDDYFQFAQVLIIEGKRNQADSLLEHILQIDPNVDLARRTLTDLRNYQQYYKDSTAFRVQSLSINTPESEFAPVYYKEGIVFSSSKHEGPFKKKSHWDNSPFLNLYYTNKAADHSFVEPKLFEENLNTRHHDGPAMFYSNHQKMIVNRNQRVKVAGREKVYEWRPGLYDAQFDKTKSSWQVVPLPFNVTTYSYLHPSISEDGAVLYFVSDKPGGYGGTDLYRSVRSDGAWGAPFNLGPVVNTAQDEAFPFLIDSTLYFTSNGHGGVGGLDIFKSEQSANGFTPPVNLGYPINSTADDFSLITRLDQREGYYASSRQGSDDLYSFQKLSIDINIFAHIFDGETKVPLSGAHIQIITNNDNDSTLNADKDGNFTFKLPAETAYVIIGTQDDKIGIVSDIADQPNEKQLIAAYRDTTRLACIGTINDQQGLSTKASVISITDSTTGQKLEHPGDKSLITFKGEKGHTYIIEIQNEQGGKALHHLAIKRDDKGTKTFTMILPNIGQNMIMAARVFRADNKQPLGYANVKVITFDETDQELTANAEGLVDFNLMEGTAYVVIGSKDNFTGMHSGMANRGMDKSFIIHPVPAYGDRENVVLAVGLVTNKSGEVVGDYKAIVTNRTTGSDIPVTAEKGVMTFLGERGKSYNISVSHEDYQTSLQEISIPSTGPETEKFAVILENKLNPGEKELPMIATKTDGSEVLVLDTEKATSKMYIKSGESLTEVTEKDIKALGMQKSHRTNLRNIYFDFDKATLDNEDMVYLDQVTEILEHDHSYKLLIAGHADDRGNENYNIRLSKRRVQVVSKYLESRGILKDRIIHKAYGESLPVVPCHSVDCSEDDHQMNRRAEFVLRHETATTTPPVSKTSTKPDSVTQK